jgi:tetratricopeptide (TPR) repeat protein
MMSKLIRSLLLGAAFVLAVSPVVDARERKDKKEMSVSKSGRVDKDPRGSAKFGKAFEKIVKAYDAEEYDKVLAELDKLDTPKASPYEKAKIEQIRGFVYYNQDKIPEAIQAMQAAIATDALNNEEHFQLKLTVAELYHMNDQLQESIAAFDDWLKDAEKVSGRNWAMQAKNYYDQDDYAKALEYLDKAYATGEKPEKAWYQMKANALLSLGRNDEALAFGREVLAANPDDLDFVNFLTALLVDADQHAEAITMLEGLRSQGKMDKENLYNNLYVAYRETERSKEAAEVLLEGLNKGVVSPKKERYLQVGEAFYDAEDLPNALANFRKAAEMSPDDGTPDLYAGQVLLDQQKPQEARIAFATAIQKGNLRQLGNAYYQLGIAELDSNNEAAAVAAFKKAQQYPESQKNATQTLKSMGY